MLNQFVEKEFNEGYLVDYNCEVCCKYSQAEKRHALNSVENTNFLIVILRRSVLGNEGNVIVDNKINATDDIRLM